MSGVAATLLSYNQGMSPMLAASAEEITHTLASGPQIPAKDFAELAAFGASFAFVLGVVAFWAAVWLLAHRRPFGGRLLKAAWFGPACLALLLVQVVVLVAVHQVVWELALARHETGYW